MYNSDNNQFGVSIDCVIFASIEEKLHVLLVKRAVLTSNKEWSLPGDFVRPEEDLLDAPKRILHEMVNINDVFVEQVKTFGKKNRYPVTRTVTVGYYALVNADTIELQNNNSKIEEVKWVPVNKVPSLVLDHKSIFEESLTKLKRRIRQEPIGLKLLPVKFTLTQLQKLYEAILETELDVRNFRKKVFKLDFLDKLDEKEENVAHRRANLFSFHQDKYEQHVQNGFYFDL